MLTSVVVLINGISFNRSYGLMIKCLIAFLVNFFLILFKRSVESVKAGANQPNISSNTTFLPCWMKCWNSLRSYKIYKVSKKMKKIMLDDVGWSLFQNKISSNMFRRKSMNFPCWTGLVGFFIQHSWISADFERLHVRIRIS